MSDYWTCSYCGQSQPESKIACSGCGGTRPPDNTEYSHKQDVLGDPRYYILEVLNEVMGQ